MTKSKPCITLLIAALAISAQAIWNWPGVRVPLSLCEIASHPNRYNDRVVKVQAHLYCYASGVMHLNGIECGPRSDAWAAVEFDKSFSPTEPTRQFLERIRDIKQQGEYKRAEVSLTGRIEDMERPCFAPRFILYTYQLEQVSEIDRGTIEDTLK